MVITAALSVCQRIPANPVHQHQPGLTTKGCPAWAFYSSSTSTALSDVVLDEASSQNAHPAFLPTSTVPFSASTRSRLRSLIAFGCSDRSNSSTANGSGSGSRGSFSARFLRCESTSRSRAHGRLGMTSTTTSSPPLVHATEQSLVEQQKISNNGVALVKKLSLGAKEVVPVALLPEEIPLENLKLVLPSTTAGDSSCSSDDEEVERQQQSGSVYLNGKGNGHCNGHGNGNGSAAASRGAAAQDQDSDTLVLGKNFHELSLAITEPDMDDEVTGDKEVYMAGVLARYRKTLVERTKYHLGYPYNLDFNYQALSQLQHFSINNLGDPFIESNYGVHSRQFEVGVLDWFARLWDLEKEQYWGYITNCGTEGNLHGILVGREVLPDGVLYASKDSHYSVFKAARMYRMDVVKVDTLLSGEIDCNDLQRKLAERADRPAILNVNIGTTVKGAVDDLDGVLETLKQTGFTEDRFYIHCDGALFGLMMPFVTKAPRVTFKKPIGSVSVSGHKFIGCPMPCGIQITRIEHIEYLSRNVEYLASRDATIMGSRNGHAPLFLWYTLNRKGYRGFQKEVQRCLRTAYYLKDRLRDAGFGVMLNELSSTVVFERPQDEIFVRKWQLACQGSIAHAVVMPSVTVEKLDSFLSELIESRAKCFPDGKVVVPCIVEEVGPENCACSLHLNCTPVTKVRPASGGSNGFYHA